MIVEMHVWGRPVRNPLGTLYPLGRDFLQCALMHSMHDIRVVCSMMLDECCARELAKSQSRKKHQDHDGPSGEQ